MRTSWGTQRPFRVPHWIFCEDVFLHQFLDHCVLQDDLGSQVPDLVVLGPFPVALARRPLKSPLGDFEHMLDSQVNLARLGSELMSQFGDQLFAAQMSPDNRCLLLRRKMSATIAPETNIQLGIC